MQFGLMLILPLFLALLASLNNSWIQVDAGHITGVDIAAWPYSVGILVEFTSFLYTLHWLGPSGISFVGALGPF